MVHCFFHSVVDFSGNLLQGTIPASLSMLKNLWYVLASCVRGLSTKRVSVSFLCPSRGDSHTFTSVLSHRRYFDVESNNITGSLPVQLAAMTALEVFLAGDNMLSSTLPSQFANLTNLRVLDLFNQRSADGTVDTSAAGFTGTLPTQWSNMTSLLYVSTVAVIRILSVQGQVQTPSLVDSTPLSPSPVDLAVVSNQVSIPQR